MYRTPARRILSRANRTVELVARFGCVSILLTATATPLMAQRTVPVTGLREHTPSVHALTNAKIVVAPGRVIEKGNVIVRNGVIQAVGADAKTPADAKVWDLTGKTIYAGLIDAYGEVAIDPGSAALGQAHWNSLVTPQIKVADRFRVDAGANEKFRSQGVTVRLLAPNSGVIKGASSLVTTGDGDPALTVLKDEVAQHIRLTVGRGRGRDFPASPMGAVALARQTLYDAQWYRQAWTVYRADRTVPRPEQNDALVALQKLFDGQLAIVDASNELYFLRADAFAREFSLNAIIRGSGKEYRRLDAIRASGRVVLVPLNFPKPPGVGTAEGALNVSLEELMHWDLAPENPARLDHAGVRIAITSIGIGDPAKFLTAVRQAVKRGLTADAALRALTTTPAELYGMADRLGTIESGKIANLVVSEGDLFQEKGTVSETWVDGRRYEVVKPAAADIRGKWSGTIQLPPDRKLTVTFQLSGKPGSVSGTVQQHPNTPPAPPADAPPADKPAETTPEKPVEKPPEKPAEVKLDHLAFRDGRLSATFDAQSFVALEGKAQLTVVVSLSDPARHVWLGHIVWPDGTRTALDAARVEEPKKDEEPKPAEGTKPENKTPTGTEEKKEETKEAEKPKGDQPSEKDKEKGKEKPPRKDLPASFAVNFPLGAFGRTAAPEQPAVVAFQNATLWTCGPNGIVERGTVLVRAGRIVAVGANLEIPAEALRIDLEGKHLTPGIIDCHSHMATDGGVNEATQAITAEVRIGDFIDCNDIDIYRQLAGGVTAANVLHGSANPIGGQNQVIKLRWGALPQELKMAEAPPGIKFALGENVKQSYLHDSSRYPQSRMGVEQIFLDAFSAARDYAERRRAWEQNPTGLPPRRDLELDALAEVLERKRWIHCHSYRQDEILAFLRVLEGYGVQVGTLQHILEGYKVADTMARHGAMGSSFSDWWAYKFEVIDAIPYNGALMHHAGIVVSFNSDDRELARHLNHEAAKAVKYGGVPPAEALKFVTLNPAKQLRIDRHVGSLEVGKQADLVVWSSSPLSPMSRCEQTWIDGRRYFDRVEDRQLRDEVRKMKATLIQKVIASGESMRSPDESDVHLDDLWPREDEVCHPHYAY